MEPGMARLPKILKKLAISVATLFVLFVIGELTTRAMEPGPFSLFDSNPYVFLEDDPRVVRHAPDFSGRWDGTWYTTSERGLRGPSRDPSFSADELRVVAVGDSCTFGKGVEEQDSWPRQLEGLLASALPARSVHVWNLGHNGYSGATYERIFREIGAGLEPHIVVIGYNLNDFPNAIRAVDEKVFRDRKLRRFLPQDVRNMFGRLALYRWARQTYYHMKRESDWQNAEAFARGAADAPPEVWEQQRGYLRSIRDQAAENGGRVAVFLFPYESQVYLDSFDTTPIERLASLCEELELPFVDLAEEFRREARAEDPPRQLFLKGDRYHPNPEGYSIVAQGVHQLLRDQGWLARD